MNITRHPNFLRNLLLADAASCLAIGAALALGAGLVADRLGLPAALLRGAGLVLLPFAAFVLFVASRPILSRPAVWLIIGGNAAWVVGSAALLIGGFAAPTALGIAFVIAQALIVAVVAELEAMSLRKAPHVIA